MFEVCEKKLFDFEYHESSQAFSLNTFAVVRMAGMSILQNIRSSVLCQSKSLSFDGFWTTGWVHMLMVCIRLP